MPAIGDKIPPNNDEVLDRIVNGDQVTLVMSSGSVLQTTLANEDELYTTDPRRGVWTPYDTQWHDARPRGETPRDAFERVTRRGFVW